MLGTEEPDMGARIVKSVTCECGWEARGDDDDIIRAVQEHGRTEHRMDVSPEQALAMAKPIPGEA
jgi:predicted small metal-binding protein